MQHWMGPVLHWLGAMVCVGFAGAKVIVVVVVAVVVTGGGAPQGAGVAAARRVRAKSI